MPTFLLPWSKQSLFTLFKTLVSLKLYHQFESKNSLLSGLDSFSLICIFCWICFLGSKVINFQKEMRLFLVGGSILLDWLQMVSSVSSLQGGLLAPFPTVSSNVSIYDRMKQFESDSTQLQIVVKILDLMLFSVKFWKNYFSDEIIFKHITFWITNYVI